MYSRELRLVGVRHAVLPRRRCRRPPAESRRRCSTNASCHPRGNFNSHGLVRVRWQRELHRRLHVALHSLLGRHCLDAPLLLRELPSRLFELSERIARIDGIRHTAPERHRGEVSAVPRHPRCRGISRDSRRGGVHTQRDLHGGTSRHNGLSDALHHTDVCAHDALVGGAAEEPRWATGAEPRSRQQRRNKGRFSCVGFLVTEAVSALVCAVSNSNVTYMAVLVDIKDFQTLRIIPTFVLMTRRSRQQRRNKGRFSCVGFLVTAVVSVLVCAV